VQSAENATCDLRLTGFSPTPIREKKLIILGLDNAMVRWGPRALVLDFTMDRPGGRTRCSGRQSPSSHPGAVGYSVNVPLSGREGSPDTRFR